MKSSKNYGEIKMGKDKRLCQLLETKKALEKLLHKAILQIQFYQNRVVDYSVKLHDLNEVIEEMRGGK